MKQIYLIEIKKLVQKYSLALSIYLIYFIWGKNQAYLSRFQKNNLSKLALKELFITKISVIVLILTTNISNLQQSKSLTEIIHKYDKLNVNNDSITAVKYLQGFQTYVQYWSLFSLDLDDVLLSYLTDPQSFRQLLLIQTVSKAWRFPFEPTLASTVVLTPAVS